MKLFINKQFPKTISVFLLLTGFAFFAFQFFKQGEIEDLLRNELKQVLANEAMTWKGGKLSNVACKIPVSNDLPSFKKRKMSNFISDTEVDFQNYSNLEKAEPSKSNVSASKNGDGITSNIANYSYGQIKSEVISASDNKNISNKPAQFKTAMPSNNSTLESNIQPTLRQILHPFPTRLPMLF